MREHGRDKIQGSIVGHPRIMDFVDIQVERKLVVQVYEEGLLADHVWIGVMNTRWHDDAIQELFYRIGLGYRLRFDQVMDQIGHVIFSEGTWRVGGGNQRFSAQDTPADIAVLRKRRH